MTFKPHPVTGDVVTKKDTASIKQAVSNLLYTRKTERLFNSGLGTNLNSLVFEPLSATTASLINEEIYNVLRQYEPRISVQEISVSVNYEENGFDVELIFKVVGRNDLPINLNIFLERS